MIKRPETGFEAVAPVKLGEEPQEGRILWFTGNRYVIDAIDESVDPPVVYVHKPLKGYREPAESEPED